MSQTVFSATLLTERLENFPSWMGIEKLATHQCLPAAWILSACVCLAQKVQQHGITSLPLCLSLTFYPTLSIYLSVSLCWWGARLCCDTNEWNLDISSLFDDFWASQTHSLGHDIQPPAFGQHSLPLVGQFWGWDYPNIGKLHQGMDLNGPQLLNPFSCRLRTWYTCANW